MALGHSLHHSRLVILNHFCVMNAFESPVKVMDYILLKVTHMLAHTLDFLHTVAGESMNSYCPFMNLELKRLWTQYLVFMALGIRARARSLWGVNPLKRWK